ncbi:MAG: hypothetical protein K9N62_05945 [Verrucomicrobia bacterium]|nr:hypothetical protein [Verrucomicrobiota bacterium]
MRPDLAPAHDQTAESDQDPRFEHARGFELDARSVRPGGGIPHISGLEFGGALRAAGGGIRIDVFLYRRGFAGSAGLATGLQCPRDSNGHFRFGLVPEQQRRAIGAMIEALFTGKLACFALAAAAMVVATAADPFENLGFDEANTNSIVFGTRLGSFGLEPTARGPASDLLPGWQLFNGTEPVSEIGLVLPGFSSGVRVGLTSKELYPDFIKGKYVLGFGFTEPDAPWSLVQRGDVPSDAAFLSFISQGGGILIQPPQVSLDGQELFQVPGTPEPVGLERLMYDVRDFAGKTAELRFIYDINTSYRTLDDILFIGSTPIRFKIERSGQSLVISWLGGGTLTSSPTIDGTFTPMMNGTTTPYVLELEGPMRFYRVEN